MTISPIVVRPVPILFSNMSNFHFIIEHNVHTDTVCHSTHPNKMASICSTGRRRETLLPLASEMRVDNRPSAISILSVPPSGSGKASSRPSNSAQLLLWFTVNLSPRIISPFHSIERKKMYQRDRKDWADS